MTNQQKSIVESATVSAKKLTFPQLRKVIGQYAEFMKTCPDSIVGDVLLAKTAHERVLRSKIQECVEYDKALDKTDYSNEEED